ncbi:hypothetical protein EDD85DRAFT_146684 [Armillaria nabsnona]|nr:hypothetical protein EDD85DRAFT_146684 [Armillaria nabsnona]
MVEYEKSGVTRIVWQGFLKLSFSASFSLPVYKNIPSFTTQLCPSPFKEYVFHNVLAVFSVIGLLWSCSVLLFSFTKDIFRLSSYELPSISESSLTRTFKDSTETVTRPQEPSPSELDEIRAQIISLEEVERVLAVSYGMTEEFDTVDVFQETKARALSKMDDQSLDS